MARLLFRRARARCPCVAKWGAAPRTPQKQRLGCGLDGLQAPTRQRDLTTWEQQISIRQGLCHESPCDRDWGSDECECAIDVSYSRLYAPQVCPRSRKTNKSAWALRDKTRMGSQCRRRPWRRREGRRSTRRRRRTRRQPKGARSAAATGIDAASESAACASCC